MVYGCQFEAPGASVRESGSFPNYTKRARQHFQGINGIPKGKPEKTKSVRNVSNAWNSHANTNDPRLNAVFVMENQNIEVGMCRAIRVPDN